MPDAVAGSKVKPSYDVNTSSGTTIDNVTGLVWQRELPATYAGCSGNRSTPNDSCTWTEAKAYCSDLVLAGNSDWRLPTRIEHESTSDDTRSSPAIDPSAFPNTPPVFPNGIFWSASPYVSLADQAWAVGSNGAALPGSTATPLLVRCVRGGKTPTGTPATRYTINGNANVTDNRTGLVWQRVVDSNSYTLDGAKSYCAALGDSWRLPTKKELLTLVDVTQASPAVPIDPAAFPNTPAEIFRTASPSATSPTDSLLVTFAAGAGYAFGNPNTRVYRVRCVR
jgi:hypothetical protein